MKQTKAINKITQIIIIIIKKIKRIKKKKKIKKIIMTNFICASCTDVSITPNE